MEKRVKNILLRGCAFFLFILISLSCLSYNVSAVADEPTPYSILKEFMSITFNNDSCSDNMDSYHDAKLDSLMKGMFYQYGADAQYSDEYNCYYVDLPGVNSEYYVFMTPLRSDMTGSIAQMSGAATMFYYLSNHQKLSYGVRLIFAPVTYPYSLCDGSNGVVCFGDLCGGDCLFSYDLSDSTTFIDICSVCARAGMVLFYVPERFSNSDLRLDAYGPCVYMERSLWYIKNSTYSTNGTRFLQSASDIFEKSEGQITGYGKNALANINKASGGINQTNARLMGAVTVMELILKYGSTLPVYSSDNDITDTDEGISSSFNDSSFNDTSETLSVIDPSNNQPSPSGRKNKTVLVVAIIAFIFFILCAGGGVFYLHYRDSKNNSEW